MQRQKSGRLGKWLITIGTAIYTLIPLAVDLLTPTHIFNPDWVAHARFHTMWAMLSAFTMGLLALWFLWRKSEDRHVGVNIAGAIGSGVLGTFMIATMTMPLYGGALADANGVTPLAGGIDANLAIFLVALVMVLSGWFLAFKDN